MRKAVIFSTVMTGALAAALWRSPVSPSFAVAERTRLRAHFDSVERELRARDVPGLTAAQRAARARVLRSEEHTSELQSRQYLVCRLLLEKKKNRTNVSIYNNQLTKPKNETYT